MKKIDVLEKLDPYVVRITNFVDSESELFESRLLSSVRLRPYESTEYAVELNLTQRTKWYKDSDFDYRLVQVSDQQGAPLLQAILRVYAIRPLPFLTFKHAVVTSYGAAYVNLDAEYFFLKEVPKILRRIDGLFKIRVQAYRHHFSDLQDFYGVARRAGFHLSDPMAVSRTLIFDLQPSLEEIYQRIDAKVRKKITHSSASKLVIKRLESAKSISELQKALDAAFSRTEGGRPSFEFEHTLEMALKYPEEVLVYGLYLKENPEQLMAYTVDHRHQNHVEAISSGSLPDPVLRKIPFNYILFGARLEWCKKEGMKFLDFGGITDESSSDKLAGISSFKRFFSKAEMEIGKEVDRVLRPSQRLLFDFLIFLKRLIK